MKTFKDVQKFLIKKIENTDNFSDLFTVMAVFIDTYKWAFENTAKQFNVSEAELSDALMSKDETELQ